MKVYIVFAENGAELQKFIDDYDIEAWNEMKKYINTLPVYIALNENMNQIGWSDGSFMDLLGLIDCVYMDVRIRTTREPPIGFKKSKKKKEVSMDEIADKFGIPVEQLKIKKD